jgi:hypothetical protein
MSCRFKERDLSKMPRLQPVLANQHSRTWELAPLSFVQDEQALVHGELEAVLLDPHTSCNGDYVDSTEYDGYGDRFLWRFSVVPRVRRLCYPCGAVPFLDVLVDRSKIGVAAMHCARDGKVTWAKAFFEDVYNGASARREFFHPVQIVVGRPEIPIKKPVKMHVHPGSLQAEMYRPLSVLIENDHELLQSDHCTLVLKRGSGVESLDFQNHASRGEGKSGRNSVWTRHLIQRWRLPDGVGVGG